MRVDYHDQDFIRGCTQTCEKKKHLQQVAFSTFHNCLTQVCFTCNICRTSLPDIPQIKKNQSLKNGWKPCIKCGQEIWTWRPSLCSECVVGEEAKA